MPHKIIHRLENVSSRLEKEAILKEALSSPASSIFAKGFELALSSTTTFGVKQVPVAAELPVDEETLPFHIFLLEVQTLINREVTGHDARDLILRMMNLCHPEEWNGWYRRILIKDLRCGVDIKTVNKVLKSLGKPEIPVFECQLAHDSAKHEAKMVGKKLLSVKLDGCRLLSIVYPNGNVEQFSRNGKEMPNFTVVREQLAAHLSPLLKEPVVLDGEIMSSSFQDLMKQARRKENVDTKDASLFIFDLIPLQHFLNGSYKVPQFERDLVLQNLLNQLQDEMPNVNLLSQVEVDLNTIEGQEVFKQKNKEAIAQGYEGLMLKDPAAPYQCKRTTSWLKLKPFIEVSLTIQSFEEGTGKNAGRLGAILCEGMEDSKNIVVSVGGGFSEEQREDFWNHRETLVGKVVEVRADAITKNQDEKNPNYSLRFPRFLRFRGFADGEKI